MAAQQPPDRPPSRGPYAQAYQDPEDSDYSSDDTYAPTELFVTPEEQAGSIPGSQQATAAALATHRRAESNYCPSLLFQRSSLSTRVKKRRKAQKYFSNPPPSLDATIRAPPPSPAPRTHPFFARPPPVQLPPGLGQAQGSSIPTLRFNTEGQLQCQMVPHQPVCQRCNSSTCQCPPPPYQQ